MSETFFERSAVTATQFCGPGLHADDRRWVQIDDARGRYVQMPASYAIELARAIIERFEKK